MADEHDSWLNSALGIDVGGLKDKAQAWVEDKENQAKEWVGQKVDEAKKGLSDAEDWANKQVQDGKRFIEQKEDDAKKWINEKKDDVKKAVGSATQAITGDESGKPVPRPMEPDCKPEHGKVPGPKNHLYCGTHGHVLDVDAKTIIAASVASYAKQGLATAVSNIASKATGNSSGDPNAASGADTANGSDKDKGDLAQKVVAELNKQLDAKVANEQAANKGIFDELNHLEDNRDTNPIPKVPSFDDLEPREQQRKIDEERATIHLLEQQRLDRAKAARADARAATEKLKKDATFALFAGGAPAGAATVQGILARIAVAGSGGASLALLLTLTAACIAELKIWGDYRDTLRTLVDKAKADIRAINTNIAFSTKKIEAIEKLDPFQP